MVSKIIISTLLYLHIIAVTISHGQSQPSHTDNNTIRIGDKLPALLLSGFVNEPSKKMDAGELKGKSLLIDFWATWCGSCIASFPKLEKIKEEFGKDIEILLVTEENEQTVKTFLDRRRKFNKDSLAFSSLCNDTILKKIFPHQSIPHYVWIAKNGVVEAITAAGQVNAANIKALVEGKSLQLEIKNDELKETFHDSQKPLFINGNGGKGENIIWHSVLSGEVSGLQNAGSMHVFTNYGFALASNTDIFSLYRIAFGDDSDFYDMRLPYSRLIFKVKDSLNYFWMPETSTSTRPKLYCYNLLTPKITKAGLKHCMQDDLQKYFRLNTRWESKIMTCLVLTADDTTLIRPVPASILRTKGHGSSDYHFISKNNAVRFFKKSLSETFLSHSAYPILDETGYKGNAYFEIEADMSDWKSIDNALGKYNMHLHLAERKINVLIVTETEPAVFNQ